MKKQVIIAAVATLICVGAKSQNTIEELFADHSEIIFSFVENDNAKLRELSRIISIDSRRDSIITAYANRQEFNDFLQKGYPYTIVKKYTDKAVNMASTVAQMASWDRYPTYEVYLQMMDSFAVRYPTLCRIDTIGTSVRGRLILCAVISDSLSIDQNEPQFFYTSTMHGDEVTGYILMLRLIDHLLGNYGTDAEITRLVNTTKIYINPLSNPDGTYKGGNNTVSRATRYNANSIDLNRNFPDPWSSAPLNSIQQENTAMINYTANHNFVMSANLHGGAEVVNFPWDGYTSSEKVSADYAWWRTVGRKFVDSCRAVKSDAYTSENRSGIVVGGDWYVINNGRQDYMNYFHHIKEATIEVSETKTLSSSQLPTYWNFHRKALINYIGEVHKGMHGMVVDSVTRQPLRALITVQNYDYDSSNVFSRAGHGDFYRMLLAGRYTITASASGYMPKTIENVAVNDSSATRILFELVSDGSPVAINEAADEEICIYPNPCSEFITISGNDIASYRIFNTFGNSILHKQDLNGNIVKIHLSALPKGLYFIEIQDKNSNRKTLKFVKK